MLAIALTAVACQVNAQVNALPSLPHLLVKGQATRSVVPDRFTVSVTLDSTDVQPQTARDTVQRNLAAILQAYKSSHAIPDSLQATTFTVAPVYEYENGNQQIFKGTKATRQVVGTFASAADAKAFLQRMQAGEHVLLTGITPSVSNEGAIRSELKREAMQRTRSTATLLADAYGSHVKGLYSASDVAPAYSYGISAGQWPAPRDPGLASPLPAPAADMGANVDAIRPESLEVGTIALTEDLYAIFLIGE